MEWEIVECMVINGEHGKIEWKKWILNNAKKCATFGKNVVADIVVMMRRRGMWGEYQVSCIMYQESILMGVGIDS